MKQNKERKAKAKKIKEPVKPKESPAQILARGIVEFIIKENPPVGIASIALNLASQTVLGGANAYLNKKSFSAVKKKVKERMN